MVRVHIVVGGALAFLIGLLLAVLDSGSPPLLRVILGYLVRFFGDLSTHFSNDFFDVEVDTYPREKKFFASKGVLIEYPRLRPLSRSIAISFLLLSMALAILAVLFYGVPIEFLILIVGANLLGWLYSAPPVRLSAQGFGELVVAFVTGFVIPSEGYLVVKDQLDPLLILFTVPFVLHGFMLILSLEVPDIDIDRRGGKNTLAVRKGKRYIFTVNFPLPVVATLLFFLYSWYSVYTLVDLRLLLLFSIIPFIAGLVGFLMVCYKEGEVNRFSTLNVVSLFLFNILVNGYLIALLL